MEIIRNLHIHSQPLSTLSQLVAQAPPSLLYQPNTKKYGDFPIINFGDPSLPPSKFDKTLYWTFITTGCFVSGYSLSFFEILSSHIMSLLILLQTAIDGSGQPLRKLSFCPCQSTIGRPPAKLLLTFSFSKWSFKDILGNWQSLLYLYSPIKNRMAKLLSQNIESFHLCFFHDQCINIQ